MDEFEKLILSYRDFNFNVIEPPKNYGDVLIYKGAEKILRKTGVKYKVYKDKPLSDVIVRLFRVAKEIIDVVIPKMGVSSNGCKAIKNKIDSLRISYCVRRCKIDFDKNEVIMIQGGGDFADIYYTHGIQLLKVILNCCPENTLIIAPQSYYFQTVVFPTLFSNYKGKAYLFCREKFSYHLLNNMNFPKNIKILLSPDTAFYSIEDILADHENIQAHRFLYDLVSFREDAEAIVNDETKKLIKTKINGKTRILESDISVKAKNLSEFINIIRNSKDVYTDRLHVGIVSTLFGKRVFLFPSGYWKTLGIYLYSLKKYDNVTYVENRYLENETKLINFLS